MRLKAYAKINLSLRVFEKRPDGFHSIESVMQSVSLCDYITLTPIVSGIKITCDDPKVPGGQANIVYKAAELYLKGVSPSTSLGTGSEEIGVRGIKINIEKNIPIAAGLAGGSADAAAVLFGLNLLTPIASRLSPIDLLNLGAQIGSDVPFCLTGGTCLVKGRGEIIEKQEPWPKTYFILVCPDLHISTKWAYEAFDLSPINAPEEIKNDLEPVVVDKYPVVADIKRRLMELGCGEAQMSGSGPSVFGTVRDGSKAKEIIEKIKEDHPRSFLVETADKGLDLLTSVDPH